MAKKKSKAKGGKSIPDTCVKGWACGVSCISRLKLCRKNLVSLKGKAIAQSYGDAVKYAMGGGGGGGVAPEAAPAEVKPKVKPEVKPEPEAPETSPLEDKVKKAIGAGNKDDLEAISEEIFLEASKVRNDPNLSDEEKSSKTDKLFALADEIDEALEAPDTEVKSTPAADPVQAAGDKGGFSLPSNPEKRDKIVNNVKAPEVTSNVPARDLTPEEANRVKELIPQKGLTGGIEANSVSDRLQYGPDNKIVTDMPSKTIADAGKADGIAGTLSYVSQLKDGKQQLAPDDELQELFDVMIANGEQRITKLWNKTDPADKAKILGQISPTEKLSNLENTTNGLLTWG